MTYQEPYQMGGTDGESDKASLAPTWLVEWEKEQNDKIAILRKQVQAKRDYVFAESMYGRRERQLQFQASVRAYDVVLNLIDEVLK